MSSRQDRSHVQSVRTRPQRPNLRPRQSGAPAARAQSSKSRVRSLGAGLPLEVHRLIASIALGLLLIFAVAAPLSPQAPNVAPLVTPRINGSGSVLTSITSDDVESALFRYAR